MPSKVIIVTGASRGIGLAIARYLLEASHKVVLVARTASELENLKSRYPSQVEYLTADLTDLDVSVEGEPSSLEHTPSYDDEAPQTAVTLGSTVYGFDADAV